MGLVVMNVIERLKRQGALKMEFQFECLGALMMLYSYILVSKVLVNTILMTNRFPSW